MKRVARAQGAGGGDPGGGDDSGGAVRAEKKDSAFAPGGGDAGAGEFGGGAQGRNRAEFALGVCGEFGELAQPVAGKNDMGGGAGEFLQGRNFGAGGGFPIQNGGDSLLAGGAQGADGPAGPADVREDGLESPDGWDPGFARRRGEKPGRGAVDNHSPPVGVQADGGKGACGVGTAEEPGADAEAAELALEKSGVVVVADHGPEGGFCAEGRDGCGHLEALLAEVANLRGAQAAHEAFVALGRTEDAKALQRRLEHLEGTAVKEERKDVIRDAKAFVIGSTGDFQNQVNKALAENDARTALGLYTQVIETGKPKLKNESRTYFNRGVLYFTVKKYAEAAEDFAKAEQLGKLKDGKLLSERAYRHAFALQRLGRPEDAIAELEKALAVDAKNLQYRSLFGHLLRRVDRLDEAEKVLTDLLRESPLQESAYFELADLKRRARNDTGEAIRIMLSLLEVAPRNARAHRMLTDLYVSNGQPEKAEQHREILQTL